MSDVYEISKVEVGGQTYNIKDPNIRNIVGSLDEVSGNPVTANTDSAGIGIQTVVGIEPIQDLHGYNYPWPAGGGKNKCNPDEFEYADLSSGIIYEGDNTVSGYVPVLPNTAYVLSYEGDYELGEIAFYTSAKSYLNRTWAKDFTTPADCYFIRFEIGTHVDVSVVKPMVRLASETDPTYEPYSNVCPISGYESVEVEGCGKNLFNIASEDAIVAVGYDQSFYPNEYKNVTISKTETGIQSSSLNIDCSRAVLLGKLPAGTYTVSADKGGSAYSMRVATTETIQLPADKTNISENPSANSHTFTATGELYYWVHFYMASNITYNISNIQLEYGSTATTYEPYNPVTDLTIPLPETVYGGTLDVESGTLTVDKALVRIPGDWGWSNPYTNIVLSRDLSDNYSGMICCSHYNTIEISGWPEANTAPDNSIGFYSGKIFIKDSVHANSSQTFATYATNTIINCVLKLATPYTISLPPHQIKLLQGVNNLSTNAHSISLTYRKGKVVMNSDLEGLADSVNEIVNNHNVLEVNPSTPPTANGAMWITTT